MTISEISDFIQWEHFSDHVKRTAKTCLMDVIGCGIAGANCDQLKQQIRKRSLTSDQKGHPIFGTEHRMDLMQALFWNAQSASFFDMDDGHRKAQGHPGAPIIPAVLLMANDLDCSGKTVLESIIFGYEIAVRGALSMRQLGGPRKGSGAWSTVGVAAAVAKLTGLRQDALNHAVGLAEYMAPQAPQDRSVLHPNHLKEGIAWAACTGVQAVQLAESGFSGMKPFCDDSANRDTDQVQLEISKTYFKQYACCRWAHPALDGLEEMLLEKGDVRSQIEQITVHTFEKALLLDNCSPKNALEAMYSIPFAIGIYLLHGRIIPEDLCDRTFNDLQILAFANNVELVEDRFYTAEFPEKCIQRLTIRFQDGSIYRSGDLSAKGDPDRPFDVSTLIGKFQTLTTPVIGDKWHQVIKVIEDFDNRSARELVTLLR